MGPTSAASFKSNMKSWLVMPILWWVTVSSAGDFSPTFGTTPNTSVKHWIKYVVVGPSNHPFPIVQKSTRRHKTIGFSEELLVVTPATYSVLARFTQSSIASGTCDMPLPPPWYTVQISEHEAGHDYMCTMLQTPACQYLFGVLRLPHIWTKAETTAITGFIEEIKCPYMPPKKPQQGSSKP